MIRVRIINIPRRWGHLPLELTLPQPTVVSEVLSRLGIASQGVLTVVNDQIVDETFVLDKECTLKIVSAMSGG